MKNKINIIYNDQNKKNNKNKKKNIKLERIKNILKS